MEYDNRVNLKSRVMQMIKIQSSVRGERIAWAFFKRFLNANRDLAPSFSTSTREMDVIPRNGNCREKSRECGILDSWRQPARTWPF